MERFLNGTGGELKGDGQETPEGRQRLRRPVGHKFRTWNGRTLWPG
jgi:hypothetical protein